MLSGENRNYLWSVENFKSRIPDYLWLISAMFHNQGLHLAGPGNSTRFQNSCLLAPMLWKLIIIKVVLLTSDVNVIISSNGWIECLPWYHIPDVLNTSSLRCWVHLSISSVLCSPTHSIPSHSFPHPFGVLTHFYLAVNVPSLPSFVWLSSNQASSNSNGLMTGPRNAISLALITRPATAIPSTASCSEWSIKPHNLV